MSARNSKSARKATSRKVGALEPGSDGTSVVIMQPQSAAARECESEMDHAVQIAEKELRPKMQLWHSDKAHHSQTKQSVAEPPARGSPLPGVQASFELEGTMFEGFIAEVAARIIQTYWRRSKARASRSDCVGYSPSARPDPPQPYRSPNRYAPGPFSVQAGNKTGTLESAAERQRDGSNRSGVENIEALMNRYREDDNGHQYGTRTGQEVVEHAIGLLRAAGMQVDDGTRLGSQSMPARLVARD